MILQSILHLDKTLSTIIFNLPSNALSILFFRFLSFEGLCMIIWILIGIIIYNTIIQKGKKPHFFIELCLLILLLNVIVNPLLKTVFNRPRPFVITEKNQFPQEKPIIIRYFQIPQFTNTKPPRTAPYPSDHAFPSGHATIIFAIATLLSYRDKKRKYFYIAIAFFVAFSRVYLGYHYVLDVLAGGFIGASTVYLFFRKKIT